MDPDDHVKLIRERLAMQRLGIPSSLPSHDFDLHAADDIDWLLDYTNEKMDERDKLREDLSELEFVKEDADELREKMTEQEHRHKRELATMQAHLDELRDAGGLLARAKEEWRKVEAEQFRVKNMEDAVKQDMEKARRTAVLVDPILAKAEEAASIGANAALVLDEATTKLVELTTILQRLRSTHSHTWESAHSLRGTIRKWSAEIRPLIRQPPEDADHPIRSIWERLKEYV